MTRSNNSGRVYPPLSRPSRSGIVLGLLVATLLLVAALAWQAISAMRARHELTEHVLLDYASLAASSYAARIAPELEFWAFGPFLEPLRPTRGASLPRPAPIEIPTEEARLSIDLVRSYFRMPIDGPDLEVGGEGMPADLRARLADTLRRSIAIADREAWTSALVILPGDSPRAIVYQPIRDSLGHTRAVVGFDASLEALGVYFEYAFAIRPMVPPPLTRGIPQDSLASIEVLTASGSALYRSRWLHQSAWQASASLGPRFGDLQARATLAPDAVARIIPVGPPAAQVPLLVGLCVACAALIVASIFQIRRESELQRLRMDFVLSVSHELRTPLSQIRLFAETLRLGRVRDDGERERALAILDQEATRLTHLVENILTVSRAERRLLRITAEPLALAPMLREVAAGFEPLATAQGMRLETDLADGLWARADRDALRQMLLNLLDNGVKYGAPGQTITLSLRADGRSVLLSVQDQGPGVPLESRSRVWERFVRLAPADGSRPTGAGIGLSVVRELAALHGGAVAIEDGSGVGARFVIRLAREEPV